MEDRTPLRRREFLRRAGGAAGTGMVAIPVSGDAAPRTDDTDREQVNVGYWRESGHRAARTAAARVSYSFAFDALTIEVAPDGIQRLQTRDDIRYVERDAEMQTLAQTRPWGIDRVDAEVAHAAGDTGEGGDIAIIDTGIDDGHSDLEANLGTGVAFQAGIQSNQWNDNNGHGTHCAGIADALDNSDGVVGVSTEATLHAVKVMNGTGTGLTSDIAKGIEWTADQGYDVGNLSLGSGSSAEVVKDACGYAQNQGVFLAAAAGNSGPCTDCVAYPAAYPECLAVSATTSTDALANFSSQGPEVELAAPGDDIYSTYVAGSYATLDGTSMACPHVAGAAGQLMANGDTNVQARDRLTDTAESIGLSSNESGAGLLDVAAALGLDSSDDLG